MSVCSWLCQENVFQSTVWMTIGEGLAGLRYYTQFS
jgi:hypothetical protein